METKNKDIFKNLKIIPFLSTEEYDAYVVLSFRASEDTGNKIKRNMTFFIDGRNGVGVELEPENGPIIRITECHKDDERAEKHWAFDYFTGLGDWSQIAVLDNDLDKIIVSGEYELLFNILSSWL